MQNSVKMEGFVATVAHHMSFDVLIQTERVFAIRILIEMEMASKKRSRDRRNAKEKIVLEVQNMRNYADHGGNVPHIVEVAEGQAIAVVQDLPAPLPAHALLQSSVAVNQLGHNSTSRERVEHGHSARTAESRGFRLMRALLQCHLDRLQMLHACQPQEYRKNELEVSNASCPEHGSHVMSGNFPEMEALHIPGTAKES